MAEFFDIEAYHQYTDDVIKSQGFYVSNVYGAGVPGGIRKINENDVVRYKGAEKAAKFALAQHNEGLKFNGISNLNMEPTAGFIYYITFSAGDPNSGDVHDYQAKVWEKINTGFKVHIFRRAPYCATYQEKLEKVHSWVLIQNLQPWMDDKYLYYSCFHRFYEQLISIKTHHEVNDGFGSLCFKTSIAAEKALDAYNGTPMPYSDKLFDLVLADSPETMAIAMFKI